MHEFPELLALRGHDVYFLEFDEGRKFWRADLAPKTEKVSGRVHTSAKLILSRPFQLGIPGLDRILALFTVVPTLRRILRGAAFDAVVLYAVPTFGLQTLWLAKQNGVPVMFRALDVSHKIRSSIFSPAIKWVEKRIYKNVNLLSANNPAMADYCVELSQRKGNAKVHYPPLALSHFKSGDSDQALRLSLGFKQEDRVIVYMGSFFYFSGLKDALSEFAEANSRNQNLKFLLIGGGEQDCELRDLVQSLGIQNQVVFTGFIGYQDLPRYLKVADIAINTLEPTLVASAAFPNKVLQYMAAGVPVVSTKLRGLEQIFGQNSGLVWADDAKAVVRAAEQLLEKSESVLQQNSRRQLATVSKIFDVESAVAEFEASLMNLSTKDSN